MSIRFWLDIHLRFAAMTMCICQIGTSSVGQTPPDRDAKGLIGALTDSEDPEAAPKDLDTSSRSRRLAGRNRRIGVRPSSLPPVNVNLNGYREETKRLAGETFATVKPVSNRAAAEAELARLRERHRAMTEEANVADREAAIRRANRWRNLSDRWSGVADAVNNGADSSNLRRAMDGALAGGGARGTRPRNSPLVTTPYGHADRDEALREAGLDSGVPPASNDGGSPELSPEVSQFADAIERGERPNGVSEYDWARLSDAFERDKAETEAATAMEERDRKERRRRQLKPMDDAIRRAEEFIDKVAGFEDSLSDDEREFFNRAMAWRLQKARLEEARRRERDAEALQRERDGEAARPNDAAIASAGAAGQGAYGVAASQLENAFRELDVSGRGQPPTAAQLEDGIPYPEWTGILDYKDRVESKLRELRKEFAELEYVAADPEAVIRKRDRQRLRFRQFELESKDRLRNKFRDPLAAGYRRQALREYAKELRESRVDRVEQFKAEKLPRMEYLKGEIVKEEQRLREIEPPPKPADNATTPDDGGN